MLSASVLTDANRAADYYLNGRNYYTNDAKSVVGNGQWWGKGAEQLSLQGVIDAKQFKGLLAGYIDADTQLGRPHHDKGRTHKPGIDLTFSAPKSISMLAIMGKDERLVAAHQQAVNDALDYLQRYYAQYRQRVQGEVRIKQAGNFIVGQFTEDTSRSVDGLVDCQLHTHCVVMNAVIADREMRLQAMATSAMQHRCCVPINNCTVIYVR